MTLNLQTVGSAQYQLHVVFLSAGLPSIEPLEYTQIQNALLQVSFVTFLFQ